MNWNPLKAKKNVDSERNIVEQLANDLQKKGKTKFLEKDLLKIKGKTLNKQEKESWHHLYGICAFQRQDHEEAKERFAKGLNEFPESQSIRFSLGQEYLFLGQPEIAFSMFNECSFPKISREFTLATSRYAYLFSQYSNGISYIIKFFDIYLDLKILDDTFLYIRGLPFFGTAWSHLATHCILSSDIERLKQISAKIISNCHDYDFDFLNHEQEAYITGNYTDLLPFLYKREDRLKKYNAPLGFTRLNIAVFKSFEENVYENAIGILNSVQLGQNDFPWLEDIRILARAKIASKFQRPDEEPLVNKFLNNQPMLFEPEHVIIFGLLDYQEKIKHRAAILKTNK